MDIQDQKFALELARKTIVLWVGQGKRYTLKECPDKFKENRGVFVTLRTWPDLDLRGCIGYPEPVYPLGLGIINAAIHACSDPRFEFLKEEELEKIVVEVSILTKPELIEVKDPKKDYEKEIVIGRDGLIVKRGVFSGLLLPEVAPQHGLDVHEFLIETCLKAGMKPTCHMEKETKVYRFSTQRFGETKPSGGMIEKSSAET